MPRLSSDQWESIRAEREAGASFGDLAQKYGVDKAAIVRRAKIKIAAELYPFRFLAAKPKKDGGGWDVEVFE